MNMSDEDVTKGLDRAVEREKTEDGGGEPPVISIVKHKLVSEPCWPCLIVELIVAGAVIFATIVTLRQSK